MPAVLILIYFRINYKSIIYQNRVYSAIVVPEQINIYKCAHNLIE